MAQYGDSSDPWVAFTTRMSLTAEIERSYAQGTFDGMQIPNGRRPTTLSIRQQTAFEMPTSNAAVG